MQRRLRARLLTQVLQRQPGWPMRLVASISGVQPCLSWQCGGAPASHSAVTALRCDELAAACRGDQPPELGAESEGPATTPEVGLTSGTGAGPQRRASIHTGRPAEPQRRDAYAR